MKTPQGDASRRVLLVIGHGRTTGLCYHLLDVVRGTLEERGMEYRVHDLVADGFDPVLRLEPGEEHPTRQAGDGDALLRRYHDDVSWANAYVIIHPVWWFAPPAILKGWVDRVLVHDVAIRQEPGESPTGLLGGRRALIVQTFKAPRAVDGIFSRGISGFFWKRAVFFSVGIRHVRRIALHCVNDLDDSTLEAHRRRLRRSIGALLD